MHDYHIPTDRKIAEKASLLIISDLSLAYSIRGLASECGVTPYSLKRIFKKIYGESIASFSLRVRMEKAKELLAKTNNTLQMIAEAVGYTEGNNFHVAFKKVEGKTPGAYRKEMQGGPYS